MTGLEILELGRKSPLRESGLKTQDRIVSINDMDLNDLLDFQVAASDEFLVIDYITRDGMKGTLEIEKDYDYLLDVSFRPPEIKTCSNKCVFCFLDQNPQGMRKELYVKDEDYRYSFLFGNYVTMAHIRDDDISRIINFRLSPIYISVHATDQDLRLKLLGVKKARPIMPLMEKLIEAGIETHTQIVMCPEWNDGPNLLNTLRDLKSLPEEGLLSIAVVPLGLTKHRDNLPELPPVTDEYCRELIPEFNRIMDSDEFSPLNGRLFLADEYFIRAGVEIPPKEFYGAGPQLENGVGMIRRLLCQAEELFPKLPRNKARNERWTWLTAGLAQKYIYEITEKISGISGVKIDIIPVPNRFFGESITVTGLLTGRDIRSAIMENETGDRIFLPGNCLRIDDTVFLDDLTLETLRSEVDKPVHPVYELTELLEYFN